MRSYANLLVFESLLDNVPQENSVLNNLEIAIMQPNVKVVVNDCGTTLGRFMPTNYELEGRVELSTGLTISRSRVDSILSTGKYFTQVRTLDSCIAQGGICSKCYKASRPRETTPVVNTYVNVYPDYTIQVEIVPLTISQTYCPLSVASTAYDYILVFKNGVLLQPTTDYTLSTNSLTLNVAATTGELNLTVHYIVRTRTPYFMYLANTYSGSMLGVRPLPSQPLQLRPSLLESFVDENRLQLSRDYLGQVQVVPQNYKDYAATIRSPLEQGLYLLATYSIFVHVN